MQLLHARVDVAVIALWLGHEQVETTQIYLKLRELRQVSDEVPDLLRRRRFAGGTAA
jgi:site-specific recombinase XerD